MHLPPGIKRSYKWINQTMQRRLIFWSIGFWVVSISIMVAIFIWVGQNQMLNDTRQRDIQMASTVSRDVNAQLGDIFGSTRIFAQRLEKLSPDVDSQASTILALRLSSPWYKAVYYFDSNSSLLMHLTDPLESLLTIKNASEITSRPPISLSDDILRAEKAGGGSSFFVSEVKYAALDYTPVVYVAVPVAFPAVGERVAVFEIDLSDIWQRIDLATVGQTGVTYAVSQTGTIIAHPEPAYIGRTIAPEIQPVLSSYEGFTEYYEPVKKTLVIAAYSPVGGPTGWGIVVEQNMSEAYAMIARTGLWIMAVWLALAVIGTASIFLLMRNFTRPVKDLTATALNIAQTGSLTHTGMVQRSDEVGQLSQAFDQMVDRISEAQKAKEEATVAERTRLARELHDAVSQTLFSASLIADVLPRLWEKNREEGRKRLEEIRQLTRGALAEMRTLLFELRPSALKDVDIRELLKQLAESVTGRARIPVSLEVKGECELAPEVKTAFYRICQEALNNIVKHAGATEVGVMMVCSPDKVELKIYDNGHGFDTENTRPGSLGLGIMRERANSINAKIIINSRAGEGTQITVLWENRGKEEEK